jgi:hypothetical protein
MPKHKNIGKVKVRDVPFEKTTTMKIKRYLLKQEKAKEKTKEKTKFPGKNPGKKAGKITGKNRSGKNKRKRRNK